MIFYKVGPGLTDPARLHSSLVTMLRPVGSSTLAVFVSGSFSPSSSTACLRGGGGGDGGVGGIVGGGVGGGEF